MAQDRGWHLRTEPLYWQHPFPNGLRGGVDASSPGIALRDGPWKLHCDTRFGKAELYNLDIDSNEQWNMAEVYPEVVERLRRKTRAIYAEINGPYSKSAHFLNPDMPEGSGGPKLR